MGILPIIPCRPLLACALVAALAGASHSSAQESHEIDASDLAKQTQNPVADLVALPFQFNFNNGGDFADRTFLNLNFQPVIPFSVCDSWKAVARTIIPINSYPTGAGERSSGIGDIQEQLYFTPAESGALIWGIGPVLSLPTATAGPAETGSWAAGPGIVLVRNQGSFVLGGLANQSWTFHDEGGDPEINLLVIQPFVNYNFGQGWSLGFAPLITANWNAESGEEWTVPLGIGISRTTVFNHRPMSLAAQFYQAVERPDGVPENQFRLVVSLLYPKTKG